MSVPSQLFLSGNVSWADEEHGKNSSLYLNIKYDPNFAINVIQRHQLQSFLTIFIVILTMAFIALIMVGAIKNWLAMRRGDHSNVMEMDTVNEDNVAQMTFTAVETNDYPF